MLLDTYFELTKSHIKAHRLFVSNAVYFDLVFTIRMFFKKIETKKLN